MKNVHTISSVLTFSLLLGCAAPSFRPWKLSEIEPGMARDKVVGILGEPHQITRENEMELLFYTYREPPIPLAELTFSETDTPLRRQMQQQRLETSRFVVKMVDGLVLDYHETTE